MKFTWCGTPEDPCKGVTCPRTMTWYGHATMGMTKPAGNEADKSAIVAEFATDIARSQPPGTDGRPRLIPLEAEFEIHSIVDPTGGQYWTALYSGETPPMRLLDAAEPWSEEGAERNAQAVLAELRAAPPPVLRRRW